MLIPPSFASGWQLKVTTDKQVYHVGDTVHIYGNITYYDWYYSGYWPQADIDITWPQNSIQAPLLVDNDGRFSYNLTNVQDIGTYTVTVNCRVAGTVVTNSTTFTVIPPIVLTVPVIPYGPITTFAVLLMTAVAFQALKRRRATAL